MARRRPAGKLLRDVRGAASVEYGFLVALIVLAVMLAISAVGQANLSLWKTVATKVSAP